MEPRCDADSAELSFYNWLDEQAHEPSTCAQLVIVVVGAKGSGKSTLCRSIVNRLLCHLPRVRWLDADVGQPEFTPAGVVSLSTIEQPLLGEALTHAPQLPFEA